MIDLDAMIARWAPLFSGFAEVATLPTYDARAKLAELVDDLHDATRLLGEVRAYGHARIALSKATSAAWSDLSAPTPPELTEARRAFRAAFDRLEAVAVRLAGGDVAAILDAEAERTPALEPRKPFAPCATCALPIPSASAAVASYAPGKPVTYEHHACFTSRTWGNE